MANEDLAKLKIDKSGIGYGVRKKSRVRYVIAAAAIILIAFSGYSFALAQRRAA